MCFYFVNIPNVFFFLKGKKNHLEHTRLIAFWDPIFILMGLQIWSRRDTNASSADFDILANHTVQKSIYSFLLHSPAGSVPYPKRLTSRKIKAKRR